MPAPPNPASANRTTVQSLGSGSSGNAFIVTSGGSTVLLDCGVGIRTITRGLKEHAASSLDAIVITHEHGDHVRTLSSFVGQGIPIVSTAGTRRRASIPPPQWEEITFARPVQVGPMVIWAIQVRHDAAEPCGYLIETPDTRISIFTDLGSWHDRVGEAIRASELVVLESNHDEDMLLRGPYPAHLKRRVASDVGHLSNETCATALARALRDGQTPQVWLAHLSATNNDPELAERHSNESLARAGVGLEVLALPRRSPGPVWRPDGGRASGEWRPAPVVPASLQLGFDGMTG